MANRFSVEAVFRAIDKITGPISRMSNRVGKFHRQFSVGLNRINAGTDRFIGGMRRVATVGAIGMTIMGAAMADVIKTGAEFEQQLTNAAAKFPGQVRKGTEAFEQLSFAAREAGRTTEFTAAQAAGALNNLAMAGFDAETAIKSLPSVIDLATAAEIDLAEAARIATKSLGAFGLNSGTAEDRARRLAGVVDLLAKVSTSANTTIEEMFDAVKIGAPIARAAGISIRDTAIMIGLLADAGIDATRAATGIKRVSLAIAAPTSKAAKVMKQLRVETTEFVNGERRMRNVFAVFKDFQAAVAKRPQAERAGIFEAIFGKIGIAAGINLVGMTADQIDRMANSVDNFMGTAGEQAGIKRGTLLGRLKELRSAFESLKISIFETQEGPLNDLVIKMTKWLRVNEKVIATGIGEFFTKLIDNWPTIIKWGKAILFAGVAITTFIIVLKTFVLVMTAVNLVMAANPAVLITLAIIALITAIILATVVLIFFRKQIIGWWDDLSTGQKILTALLAPIVFLTVMAAKFIEEWDGIKLLFRDIGDEIQGMIRGLEKFMKLKEGALKLFGAGRLGVSASNVLGFNTDEKENTGSPQVIPNEERISRQIEEMKETAEVIIRDETGRAEVKGGGTASGILSLVRSGGFQN